ncbi:MAG: thioredoxin domain-containing protein, partial [Planctomycetaceae bacterium]
SERMIEQFGDSGGGGGFFFTSSDHESLIARNKDTQDAATPSGNAMAATALLKLARLTGRGDLERVAVETLDMLSGQLERVPMAGGQALIALDFLLGPTREIVIIRADRADETPAVLAELHRRFLPNTVVLQRPPGVSDEELPAVVKPLLTGKTPRDGRTTVYVCERGVCHAPVVGVEGLRSALDAL